MRNVFRVAYFVWLSLGMIACASQPTPTTQIDNSQLSSPSPSPSLLFSPSPSPFPLFTSSPLPPNTPTPLLTPDTPTPDIPS
ncbi:MAG TPA: hypothetical protein PK530_17705, partial [Anaerolineales bacterium]|nr:hypothetical protein [Anaerolineales bacterium]